MKPTGRAAEKGGVSQNVMDVFIDHTQSGRQDCAADPRTHVYLSLYLAIFGFFVVLVNASQLSEPKSSAAIASVQETLFQNKTMGTEAALAENMALTPSEQAIEEAEGVLQASFNTAEFTGGNGGRDLRLVVDAEALFYANTGAVKPAAREAFSRLDEILSSPAIRGSVFVTVSRLDTPSVVPDAVSAVNLRRVATLAAMIGGDGPPATDVFVGYAPQPAQSMVVAVRIQDLSGRGRKRGAAQ